MMNNEQKVLLSLIRSALWGTTPERIPEKTDWNAVMQIAFRQTVSGLVSSVIAELPECSRPDQSLILKLQMTMMKNIQAHALLNRKLAETDIMLREKGIFPVLFKGQGLALMYPDPLTRQCGDIDLYIGPDNYDEACDILIGRYGRGEHDSESFKHYHLSSEGVSIELHKIAETIPGIRRNRRFQDWTLENLKESVCPSVNIADRSIAVPPVSFNAIYIMNHIWHHFVNGGIGLRQLCDWTLYLHSHYRDINIEDLKHHLKSFGLYNVWQMMGGLVVRYLGLPEEEFPLYEGKYEKGTDRMMAIIFEEGNFGKYDPHRKTPRPKGYLAGKLHSFQNISKRYLRIFSIYPSRAMEYWIHYIISGVYHYFKGL